MSSTLTVAVTQHDASGCWAAGAWRAGPDEGRKYSSQLKGCCGAGRGGRLRADGVRQILGGPGFRSTSPLRKMRRTAMRRSSRGEARDIAMWPTRVQGSKKGKSRGNLWPRRQGYGANFSHRRPEERMSVGKARNQKSVQGAGPAAQGTPSHGCKSGLRKRLQAVPIVALTIAKMMAVANKMSERKQTCGCGG